MIDPMHGRLAWHVSRERAGAALNPRPEWPAWRQSCPAECRWSALKTWVQGMFAGTRGRSRAGVSTAQPEITPELGRTPGVPGRGSPPSQRSASAS
jgi:hypothetical protein